MTEKIYALTAETYLRAREEIYVFEDETAASVTVDLARGPAAVGEGLGQLALEDIGVVVAVGTSGSLRERLKIRFRIQT